MNDFLKFLKEKVSDFPMHVDIHYDRTADWVIRIYKKGCAEDYPESKNNGNDAIIVFEQDLDMELCFAKAHIALKEWLLNNEGGY